MKGKNKIENKKWLFLGAAILLATVVIAVILNLPSASYEGVNGTDLNAAVISAGTQVTVTRQAPTGDYKSFFAVPRSNPINLGVKAYVPKDGRYNSTYYAENSAVMIFRTSSGTIIYCIELGNPSSIEENDKRPTSKTSDFWTKLGEYKQENIGLVTLYSYPNKSRSGYSELEQYAAAQILIWEFQQGWRTNLNDTPSNKEIYNRWIAKSSKLKAVYESILSDMRNHSKASSFLGQSLKLTYNSSTKKYEGSITDSNGVLASMKYTCPSGLTCSRDGNTLKITSSSAITISKEITFTKNLPTGTSQGLLILDNGSNQRMIVGKASVDAPSGKLKVSTQAVQKLSSLTITKETEDNSNDSFKFLVTSILNAYSKTITIKGGEKVTLSDLKPGIYTVTEIDLPDRYARALPYPAMVGNNPVSITIKNYLKNKGRVIVNKVDEEGAHVKGATMVIKNKLGMILATWVTDGKEKVIDNTDRIVNLQVGEEYKVCEIKAPAGYKLKDECETFKLESKSDSVVVNFVNEKSELTITKVDKDGKPLAGAILRVKDSSGKVVVQPWETTETQSQAIRGLIVNEKYTIEEMTAPDGYVKLSKTFTAKDGANIKFENEETVIYISKQDATNGKEIAGAHLQVINSAGSIVDEWVSEEGKTHTIKGLTLGEVYTLKETIAPNGYLMSESIKFTFNQNKMKITMKDDPSYVEISKQDATTKKKIGGAVLEVLDSNGKSVERWTTEEGKSHTIKGLTNGKTYTLKEISAPDGYFRQPTEIKFVAGEQKEYVMLNTPTKVTIKKLDTVTNKRVTGAHLQLLDEKGKVVSEWDTTDEDKVITGLPAGKQYSIKETKVPDNYLQAEVVTFTLEQTGPSIEVIVNNTPIVYVPDTAVDVNVIMIIVGAVVALGGIGAIIWIRKRSA